MIDVFKITDVRNIQRAKLRERQKDTERLGVSERDRQTHTERDRESERDRQTDTERDRERQRERERLFSIP